MAISLLCLVLQLANLLWGKKCSCLELPGSREGSSEQLTHIYNNKCIPIAQTAVQYGNARHISGRVKEAKNNVCPSVNGEIK